MAKRLIFRCDIGNRRCFGSRSSPSWPAASCRLRPAGRKLQMRHLSRKPAVGRSSGCGTPSRPSQLAAAAAEPPACHESDQPLGGQGRTVDRNSRRPRRKRAARSDAPDRRPGGMAVEPDRRLCRERRQAIRARSRASAAHQALNDPNSQISGPLPASGLVLEIFGLVLVLSLRPDWPRQSTPWAGPLPGPRSPLAPGRDGRAASDKRKMPVIRDH